MLDSRGRKRPKSLTSVLQAIVLFTACVIGTGCSKPNVPPTQAAHSGSQAGTININTASAEELARIPFVGEAVAERIIEYRNTYGPFDRPEELILVDGISDSRFRQIRHLISVR